MKKSMLVWGAVIGVLCAFVITGCAQKAKPVAPKAELKRIHFDFDKYNIKNEYVPVLKGSAEWIKAHPGTKVVVEGHCDNRGSNEYNIALGDRRAKSAKAYLVNLGINAADLSTVSYGEEKPLCTENNEGCWWKNRRAEFMAK